MSGDDDAVMPSDQGISRKPRARAGGAAREDPNGLTRKGKASGGCEVGIAAAGFRDVVVLREQMIEPVEVGQTG